MEKEIRLSDKFREVIEEHGLSDLEVCLEAINHYIEHLDIEDDYFSDKVENEDKFKFFIDYLRENYTNEERKERFHADFFKTLQRCGIKNDEVLHWYILEFLGFNIPRKPVCKLHAKDHEKFDYPHCAPFDYVSDMFFERVRSSIAFANRTGGKTQNVAILNHLDMAFKPRCEVGSAGAIVKQADRMYKYFLDAHRHPILKNLYEKDPTKTETYYKNGSKLETITGTKAGFNGFHGAKVRIDEVELIEWDLLQEAYSMSQSKKGESMIVSQNSMLSTRKNSVGTFQRVLDDSEKSGAKIYCWCIWDVLEKCTRKCKDDPEHGTCPIKHHCKGIAKNCEGFYNLDDFIDKTKLLSQDVLDAQWFNKKPSMETVVYGDYWNEDVHMVDPYTKPDSDHYMVMSAIDFGASEGHDFVYQKHWVDYSDLYRALEYGESDEELTFKLKFYLFYEYRSGSGTMMQHSEKIKASPEFEYGEIIFADPSAKQSRIDLYKIYNINTYEAINAVEDGIDLVKSHLEVYTDWEDGAKVKSNFYILENYLDCDDEKLLGTHREFTAYRYAKHVDGKVNRRVPLKIYDHGMDDVRYVVQSAYPAVQEVAIPVYEHIDRHGYWG